jgi:hypothetical protein
MIGSLRRDDTSRAGPRLPDRPEDPWSSIGTPRSARRLVLGSTGLDTGSARRLRLPSWQAHPPRSPKKGWSGRHCRRAAGASEHRRRIAPERIAVSPTPMSRQPWARRLGDITPRCRKVPSLMRPRRRPIGCSSCSLTLFNLAERWVLNTARTLLLAFSGSGSG